MKMRKELLGGKVHLSFISSYLYKTFPDVGQGDL